MSFHKFPGIVISEEVFCDSVTNGKGERGLAVQEWQGGVSEVWVCGSAGLRWWWRRRRRVTTDGLWCVRLPTAWPRPSPRPSRCTSSVSSCLLIVSSSSFRVTPHPPTPCFLLTVQVFHVHYSPSTALPLICLTLSPHFHSRIASSSTQSPCIYVTNS